MDNVLDLRLAKILVLLVAGISLQPRSAVAQLDATEIYEQVLPSMCAVLALSSTGQELGLGSGFRWGKNLVVTNRHVIAGAEQVRLDCNGERATADSVVRYSDSIDLVVLQARFQQQSHLASRETEVKPGESVFAIGNPLGLTNTITTGLVSGIREFEDVQYLQISADINPGNSGGPILDEYGNLVGIATMGVRSAQGLNFAIPAHYIEALPKTNISFAEIIRTDKDAHASAEILSSLSFRGISLGSPCSDVVSLQHFGTIGTASGQEFHNRFTGSVVGQAELLGHKVEVTYRCRYGWLVSGSYNYIPDAIHEIVTAGLVGKYGAPQADRNDIELKARVILVESEREALTLIERLSNGASFETLAHKYSVGPSGSKGGDLGWSRPDKWVSEFADAVLELGDGEYSNRPVQTAYGWHVILREASRQSKSSFRPFTVWDLGNGENLIIQSGRLFDPDPNDFLSTMYEKFLTDPNSVPSGWRENLATRFRGFEVSHPSGTHLTYTDRNLRAALERKEVLRAVQDDAL